MDKVIVLLTAFGLLIYALTVNPQVWPALVLLAIGYIGIVIYLDHVRTQKEAADRALDPNDILFRKPAEVPTDRIFGSSITPATKIVRPDSEADAPKAKVG